MEIKPINLIIVNKIIAMKQLIQMSVIFLLLFTTSCHAQQMVRTIPDAKKLEINEKKFIGKPLSKLIHQIAPKIKSALGDPEMHSTYRVNHITFYFVTKEEYYAAQKKGKEPIGIQIYLTRPDNKKYPPLCTTCPWTEKQTKIYGDMIVQRIRVLGGYRLNK